MMASVEIELRFLVPAAARVALLAEIARRATAVERRRLSAIYLDTGDRRLARAGIGWRLRREGRRWIQNLKARGSGSLERFEHEVIRPGATHDAAAHADTVVGKQLIAILGKAGTDGVEVGVRFRSDVTRTSRRIRTRGAVVEVSFDEGRLVAADSSRRIREVEFELISGPATAMIALAERWRKRFDLILEPHSKAERGDRLAEGLPYSPVRRARNPSYTRDASARVALGAVIDECLAQISCNAVGIVDGSPTSRVEHVHQLRVGIRRLRSALRTYAGWTPPPPPVLVADLRTLFAVLVQSRDSDVLDSGVVAELAKVGAPQLKGGFGEPGPDPVDVIRAATTQRLLLAWIGWRAALSEGLGERAAATGTDGDAGQVTLGTESAATATAETPTDAPQASEAGATEVPTHDPVVFHQVLQRRLRRWHRRIAADSKVFDDLDEASLHSLRKRIKRQRYAVEFFAPVLRASTVDRYVKPLAAIQDRMGELNDLFVARGRFQALVAVDPAAWFALGWIAARISEVRALAKPELAALARADPPKASS
jgi:inorganic triphosphatase YgiF